MIEINRFEINRFGELSQFGRPTNLRTDSFGSLIDNVSGRTIGKIDSIGRVNSSGGELLGFSRGIENTRLVPKNENFFENFNKKPLSDLDLFSNKKNQSWEITPIKPFKPEIKTIEPIGLPKKDLFNNHSNSNLNLFEPNKFCSQNCISCLERWSCNKSTF